MSAANIVIPPGALSEFIAAIAVARGSGPEEARLVASNLVLANLSGHDSHGVGMMPWYVRYIGEGGLAINQHLRVSGEFGTMLMVDGQRGYGQVIGREAMQLGMACASKNGMALVALKNSHHLGRIGQWAEDCAAASFVSIHFVNALLWPIVAPFAGSDARFATNPFCVGVPREGEAPLILDFATSKIALGKVRVAMQAERQVAPGTLLDSRGYPSSDPRVMFEADAGGKLGALLPFGEHKGYGMALICEILGGALTGGETMHQPGTLAGIYNNMLSIIIDPARLDKGSFHREMEAFIAWVRDSPVAPGHDKLRISGEPELEMRARRANGIPIEENTWADLQQAATQAGMSGPDLGRHAAHARPE